MFLLAKSVPKIKHKKMKKVLTTPSGFAIIKNIRKRGKKRHHKNKAKVKLLKVKSMSEKVTIYIKWETKKAYMDSAFKNQRSLSREISVALEENPICKKDKKNENN